MHQFPAKTQRMDILEGCRIARVLPLVQGRLLDVGCGFNNLVRAYGSGVGMDVVGWPGVDVIVENPVILPFPSACFDTVTMLATLNHIPDRAQVLAETRRVLCDDGRLVLTMIGPNTGRLAHWLFRRDEGTRGGMQAGEKRGMRREEVIDLLGQSGFAVLTQVPFQLGLNRVFVAVKSCGASGEVTAR
jgi:SAM-dependent methyltransferase